MPGYIKFILIFILSLAVASLDIEIVVSAVPDNNESVDSYFNNKDSNTESGNTGTIKTNDTPETDETMSSDVGISFGDIFRMIFALLFVAGLLFVLLRVINKKNRGYQHGQIIENMGGTPLGGNRSIQMVRIGETIYIVGVGDTVQLLNVIDDREEYNRLMEEHNEKVDQQLVPKDFVTMLMNKWKSRSPKQKPQSFSIHFQEQLEELKKDRQKVKEDISKKGTHRDE